MLVLDETSSQSKVLLNLVCTVETQKICAKSTLLSALVDKPIVSLPVEE